ncbi:MAG: hypothetical protein OXD29_04320 [Roseovarius sp.]|nr:hypothetical protein [Roseovarius sp.]
MLALLKTTVRWTGSAPIWEKCGKATIQWTAGLVLGAAVLIIAVLGILIRWPVPPT